MAFALSLFTINISNTFYLGGVSDDLSITPDEATKQKLAHYRMKFATTSGSLEVSALTAGFTNPLSVLQRKLATEKFRFLLRLNNPNFIEFTDIQFDPELATAYYFSNSPNEPKLHSGKYVTDTDKQPLLEIYPQQAQRVCSDGIEKSFMGMVVIDMATLLLEEHAQDKSFLKNITSFLSVSKETSKTLEQFPKRYVIQFKARSS